MHGKAQMTKAQRLALEMLSLEAIDLYIISEELKDAFEDEVMRIDTKSYNAALLAIERARISARRSKVEEK